MIHTPKRCKLSPLLALVAIIDTGADLNHPAISSQIWQNPNEILNDKDDDGNGFINDLHGWNFTNNSSSLKDLHGHGTHIAGIIAKQAPRSQLMILKYYDDKDTGTNQITATIKAIRYAVQMGADIINYSAGGNVPDPEELKALREAEAKGVLVVSAAGNNQANNDLVGYFPANYPLSNIISVAAEKKMGEMLPASNFGSRSVDLIAPGFEIRSSHPQGKFVRTSGTSQATAYVSGVAARVLSEKPYLKGDAQSLIRQLVASATRLPQLKAKVKEGSQINIQRAIAMADANQSSRGHRLKMTDEPSLLPEDLNQRGTTPQAGLKVTEVP